MWRKEKETRVKNTSRRRAGEEKSDRQISKKKVFVQSSCPLCLFYSDFLSLFSLSCFWIVLSVPSLSLSSLAPCLSCLISASCLFSFSLSLFHSSQALALCLLNESESLCRLCFLRHDASGKSVGFLSMC